jgi:AcrR family transcriptional regulator
VTPADQYEDDDGPGPPPEPQRSNSRRTRAALLAAARAIVEEKGFGPLTMSATGKRAGVTRRAAYLHFESRPGLVAELARHVARTEGVADSLRAVWEAPDGATALEEWGRHLVRVHARVRALRRSVDAGWRTDADVAAYRERERRSERSEARRLAQRLQKEGRLAPPWTVATATDALAAVTDHAVLERLMAERRWSVPRLGDHLAALLRGAFVTE